MVDFEEVRGEAVVAGGAVEVLVSVYGRVGGVGEQPAGEEGELRVLAAGEVFAGVEDGFELLGDFAGAG